MGKLIYGTDVREIEIDDRVLAHLKIAIIAKLRRSESFSLSWEHGAQNGGGRSTVWIHESIPLQFVFFGSRPPSLNRAWVDELMASANSGSMQILPEPAEAPKADGTVAV